MYITLETFELSLQLFEVIFHFQVRNNENSVLQYFHQTEVNFFFYIRYFAVVFHVWSYEWLLISRWHPVPPIYFYNTKYLADLATPKDSSGVRTILRDHGTCFLYKRIWILKSFLNSSKICTFSCLSVRICSLEEKIEFYLGTYYLHSPSQNKCTFSSYLLRKYYLVW